MPKLDFLHMAAWTSMGICSHPWLLRFRFLFASRVLPVVLLVAAAALLLLLVVGAAAVTADVAV